MLVNHNIYRDKTALGESQENYLEAILILGEKQRPVRIKDIARFLNVSRPAVVAAIGILAQKGLVRHEHYGGVELTAKGRLCADGVYQRHLLLERFLREVIGVSREVAQRDACRLEHALSQETIRGLRRLMQSHRLEPKGNSTTRY
ncbi:MAG: metal-dependent transcriptional regulator [candidate division WOR-3 bacterium]